MKKLMFCLVLCLIFNTTQGLCQNQKIKRTFEDLSLGMSKEEYTKKGVATSRSWGYAYSHPINVYQSENLRELPNIWQVLCFFWEGKLFGFEIQYDIRYAPGWDTFIYNAKQNYGPGAESHNEIRWNDGQTTLVIKKESGDQSIYDSHNYGEYYSVTYIDNKMYQEWGSAQKSKSPNF